MSASGLPFDDIRTLCQMLPPPDAEAMAAVVKRNARLAKPVGSLGRLEEIVVWLAGWQGNANPQVVRPLTALFAGSHGVALRPELAGHAPHTAERLAQAAAGGAAINQICALNDIGLKVFELAIPHPTRDIVVAAALEEKECAATIAFGMEALAGGADLICLGECGSGNAIVTAAMLTALAGGDPADWLDGVAPDRQAADIALVEAALAAHTGHLGDPLEVLRRLGGREIAAAVGAILAARIQRIPVILDGLPIAVAATVLFALAPDALDHCLAGHVASPVHRKLLERLGLKPVLDLEVTLGEGAGAALAAGVVRAALACHNGMAEGTGAAGPVTLN